MTLFSQISLNNNNLFVPMINLFMDIITQLMGIILIPLGVILNQLFPASLNLDSLIFQASWAVQTLTSYMAYPLTILPETFRTYLGFIVDIEITWIIGSIAYYSFLLLFRWIKTIKFW